MLNINKYREDIKLFHYCLKLNWKGFELIKHFCQSLCHLGRLIFNFYIYELKILKYYVSNFLQFHKQVNEDYICPPSFQQNHLYSRHYSLIFCKSECLCKHQNSDTTIC